MKLVTFQPTKVYETLKARGHYRPEDCGYGPYVYCLSLGAKTMQQLYHTSPTMPQMLMVLDVPVSRVRLVDYVSWHNQASGLPVAPPTYKHCECRLDYLLLSDVIDTQMISASDDADEVQDAFMATHYPVIEQASGYEWYKLDDMPEECISAAEYNTCILAMIQILSPVINPITDEEVTAAEELMCEYFRGKKDFLLICTAGRPVKVCLS